MILSDSPSPRQSRRPWLPALLSALLALALYAVTLGGVYVYDDAKIISLDDRVKNPALWGQFWTRDYFNGALDNLYRPLVSQSYGLQWWLHGDRPWAFHLVNLLLHALAAALVAEFARRLVNWRVGLIAGLLFAAHPVHSEAVAGVVGRAELACAVGLVGAMVLFLKRPLTVARVFAIYALAVVALLSKEQGMLSPFLLAALLLVRRHQAQADPPLPETDRQEQRQRLLLLFALLVWTVGGLVFLREEVLPLKFEWERGFLDVAIQPMIHSTGADRWLLPLALLGRYFQLLVAPLRLSIDYGLDVLTSTQSLADPYLWLGATIFITGIIAAIVSLLRRRWVVFFCLLAMALTYSMASNVILIGDIFGERLVYIPSIFFLILLAMAIAKLPPRWAGTLIGILLILASVRTFTYIRRWNDRNAFYAYALKEQPRSLRLYMLVGFVNYESGDLATARRVMAEAENLDPNYWQLWQMSAKIAEKAGDWNEAVRCWKRAFDLAPAGLVEIALMHAEHMRDLQKSATAPSTRP